MHILITNLHKRASRFGEQLSGDQEPIAKNRQVGVNPELPGVPESPHLLWLTSSVLHLAVFYVALASADLPVRPEFNPVGRVDVDHLHLALEAFLLGKARHDMERVPQDHAIGPFLIVLVKLNLAVKLQCIEVVEESGQESALAQDGLQGGGSDRPLNRYNRTSLSSLPSPRPAPFPKSEPLTHGKHSGSHRRRQMLREGSDHALARWRDVPPLLVGRGHQEWPG